MMTGKRKDAEPQPILPTSLLVAGQPCLVVGGGPIAARKVGHLLDAEADVTVVAAQACDAIAGLAEDGRVRLMLRPFRQTDVDGMRLVFAATDDEGVNGDVLACCRGRKVLCSAADSHWREGDFVMPAICRKRGLVVTVATGGQSCLRARVVKDRIAESLDALDENDIPSQHSQ